MANLRKRRYDPVKINRLLKSKPVAQLLNRVNALEKISLALNNILPNHISDQCCLLNLSDDSLTIGVNDAMTGHQLYYQQTEILNNVNQQLKLRLKHLKIKSRKI